MKGITPVVAIILLLLITISLVGFAFIYFTRITETAATNTENQLENIMRQQQIVATIDNQFNNTVYIRNMGSATFALGNVTVYVNNSIVTCSWNPGIITPGAVSVCTLPNGCGAGGNIKITSPGGQDYTDCTT